jgi:conjugal transfer pilus assembly protein TraD
MSTEAGILLLLSCGLGAMAVFDFYQTLSLWQAVLFVTVLSTIGAFALLGAWELFSKAAKERRKRFEKVRELPTSLILPAPTAAYLGRDQDLEVPVFLPDSIRARHVHILGATGSGKTESVILNLLRQDVERGYGAIILDAKGDASFIRELEAWIPEGRRKVFDLSSDQSLTYDPLEAGSPLEAAQRLFSSLLWSEEYYKSKAFSALQRLFELHHRKYKRNPTLSDLNYYLETDENFSSALESEAYPAKLAARDFMELSGLRDQVRGLTIGYLEKILSPEAEPQLRLESAWDGQVLYFRLQSLLSQQLVGTVGRLLINHMSYLAGTAHRKTDGSAPKFLPTYLDEFASFACPEFADLISKARSAGMALHFSHQSAGDLAEVSPGFMSRVTDNSATKIVLRINDPDTAELMSRTFGTSIYQKVTQRITNAEDIDSAEVAGEGSQREAHQFRAAPDLLKTLPTGTGAVLIAHGEDTPHGASSVFRVRFPRLGAG